jgi:hypothetical protein
MLYLNATAQMDESISSWRSPTLEAGERQSFHTCSYCPLISLDVEKKEGTVTIPVDQVVISAFDGCQFHLQRLKRLISTFALAFPERMFDAALLLPCMFSKLSLKIVADLSDDICYVECEWEEDGRNWDEIDDPLFAYARPGTYVQVVSFQ